MLSEAVIVTVFSITLILIVTPLLLVLVIMNMTVMLLGYVVTLTLPSTHCLAHLLYPKLLGSLLCFLVACGAIPKVISHLDHG